LEFFDQFICAAGVAVQRGGKPREVLIGPRGGNAEAGMDEQERLAAQRGKVFERPDFFAASGGQRGLVLEKKRGVRAERRCNFMELFRRKRHAEKFVEREERRGGVAAAAAKPGGERYFFLQVNFDGGAYFCRRQEIFCRAENQVF